MEQRIKCIWRVRGKKIISMENDVDFIINFQCLPDEHSRLRLKEHSVSLFIKHYKHAALQV